MTERPCQCDRVHGPEFVRGRDCGLCWRWTYRRSSLMAVPAAKEVPVLGRCIHLGIAPIASRPCLSCNKDNPVLADVYPCSIHGECTVDRPARETPACCKHCSQHSDRQTAAAKPTRIVRIDDSSIPRGQSNRAFNASIFRFQDRLLLAYRTDWAGAQIHVATLDEDYRPVGPAVTLMGLFHPTQANYGREDPRLFEYRGELHVAYIGVSGQRGPTHQMYARLGDDLSVDRVFAPRYPFRAKWEKNWSMFEFERHLLAIYQTGPIHRIVRIDGEHALPFVESANSLPWSGGLLRGGAPPVRTGDTFTHWFHGGHGQDRNIGVNEFEAVPPFRVIRQSRIPMYEQTDKEGNYCHCAFVCGAILEDGVWKVSMGINDRRIEVVEWKADDVRRAMG